jgi:NADH-quinone oxidoreductase subunit K
MAFYHFFGFGIVIFTIGVIGFMVRNNVIVLLMSVELMLNAVNLMFVAFSRFLHGGTAGQIYVFIIMTVAAAEVAVGLAIVVALYRRLKTLDVRNVRLLKG